MRFTLLPLIVSAAGGKPGSESRHSGVSLLISEQGDVGKQQDYQYAFSENDSILGDSWESDSEDGIVGGQDGEGVDPGPPTPRLTLDELAKLPQDADNRLDAFLGGLGDSKEPADSDADSWQSHPLSEGGDSNSDTEQAPSSGKEPAKPPSREDPAAATPPEPVVGRENRDGYMPMQFTVGGGKPYEGPSLFNRGQKIPMQFTTGSHPAARRKPDPQPEVPAPVQRVAWPEPTRPTVRAEEVRPDGAAVPVADREAPSVPPERWAEPRHPGTSTRTEPKDLFTSTRHAPAPRQDLAPRPEPKPRAPADPCRWPPTCKRGKRWRLFVGSCTRQCMPIATCGDGSKRRGKEPYGAWIPAKRGSPEYNYCNAKGLMCCESPDHEGAQPRERISGGRVFEGYEHKERRHFPEKSVTNPSHYGWGRASH